jgi:hypothetical protein
VTKVDEIRPQQDYIASETAEFDPPALSSTLLAALARRGTCPSTKPRWDHSPMPPPGGVQQSGSSGGGGRAQQVASRRPEMLRNVKQEIVFGQGGAGNHKQSFRSSSQLKRTAGVFGRKSQGKAKAEAEAKAEATAKAKAKAEAKAEAKAKANAEAEAKANAERQRWR